MTTEAGLTPRLEHWVIARFGPEAPFMLAQLRAYDPGSTGQASERILAAIAMVGADQSLPIALELGRVDWRDLLVSAGLADEDWPDVLQATLGEPRDR